LLLCLSQIKPVHGLSETQVGVNTRNDNAGIYRQQLDAQKGDANVDIDYQALVQDGVEDVSEAAGSGAVKIAVARLGRDGHEINSLQLVDWALAPQAASSLLALDRLCYNAQNPQGAAMPSF
jgi:hypothetical protein